MSFDAFEFLKKLEFTRVSSSLEELKAAYLIRTQVQDIGGFAELSSFDVTNYEVTKASLRSSIREYEVTGIMGSGSITNLIAPFYYMETTEDFDSYKIAGKIVLINGRVNQKIYKKLLKYKAVAFISYTGDVIDEDDKTDIKHLELRPYLIKEGIIPGLNMTAKTAMQLVRDNPTQLEFNIEQKGSFAKSNNIIAEIKGDKYPNEVITLTAHYDSVEYSKGVYDNASGSCLIMKLYEYFYENTPNRTLRFIWCGSEERGLLGSKAYVEKITEDNDEEIKKIIFNINVDVAAPVLGYECAICTSDTSLCEYVKYLACEIAYPIVVKQDIYSSDSIPFADKGIPAINFLRVGAPGGAHIHDRYDTMYFLSEQALNNTYVFLEEFTKRIVNMAHFPVEREMPENLVKKIDEYLFKKDTLK